MCSYCAMPRHNAALTAPDCFSIRRQAWKKVLQSPRYNGCRIEIDFSDDRLPALALRGQAVGYRDHEAVTRRDEREAPTFGYPAEQKNPPAKRLEVHELQKRLHIPARWAVEDMNHAILISLSAPVCYSVKFVRGHDCPWSPMDKPRTP